MMIPLGSRQPAPSRVFIRLGRYVPVALLGGALVGLAFLTRVGLVVVHGAWDDASWHGFVRAFLVGAVYDVTVALWLLLPLAIYLTAATSRWLARRWQPALMLAGAAATIGVALFVAAAEAIFFSEFDGRFNFVAVDYLIYPTEVMTNIWESYPTAWVLAAIAAVTGAIVYFARRPLRASLGAATPRRDRLAFGATYVLALAALTLTVSPGLAHVSENRALNEVASNGYYAFWKALLGQGTRYDALYATRAPEAVLPRIHTLLSDSVTPSTAFAAHSTLRHVPASPASRRLNVVVVLEESLGAQFIGALHPSDTAASLTPHFDSLAAEGTLLTQAFSTGNRTIRALEATTSSLPPLPGVSVVRRPESVDLFTLPAVLRSRGYATEFIYGGRALFDGMGEYMRNNGMERVIEQRDYPDGQFTTAWGVADEAIFDKALGEMDSLYATHRPFYTLVLTVSNHRPYTYPPGRIGPDPEARKRVNVVQYADWALGRFIHQAKQHAFFDSTVFVLMGDHGPRVYGASEIPLPSYSVPVLFLAPGIVPAGRRVNDLTSSMDIPPTVLGLLGGDYDSKFFGRDVLAPRHRGGLAVMTHNNEIALMRGDRLAVLGLRGATTVYAVDSLTRSLHRVAPLDPSARELIEDAIAYFETADELYRHGDYRFGARSTMVAGRANASAASSGGSH